MINLINGKLEKKILWRDISLLTYILLIVCINSFKFIGTHSYFIREKKQQSHTRLHLFYSSFFFLFRLIVSFCCSFFFEFLLWWEFPAFFYYIRHMNMYLSPYTLSIREILVGICNKQFTWLFEHYVQQNS